MTKVIFIILVSISFNFFIYLYIYRYLLFIQNLFSLYLYITADKNGDYPATIDIEASISFTILIIHLYSTSVNGNKS